MTPDTCPRCGAPDTSPAREVGTFACGTPYDRGVVGSLRSDACDYAASLRDEVKAARDNATYYRRQRNAAYAEVERLRVAIGDVISVLERGEHEGIAEDALRDAWHDYREQEEATDDA
jgi:hypothetical protein